MRHTPEQELITRESRSERRKRDALKAARAARAPDASHRLAIRAALKACADELGPFVAFAAGVAEVIRYAPQISVKRTARDEAEGLFNPARRRGWRGA